MARTTLAERMTRLDQQKARIAEQEAKLKNDERKQRTRRLIEAGGLIEKAGLIDLGANALYGALLSLGVSAKNSNQVDVWAKAGDKNFAREAKTRDASKEPLIVTFPTSATTPFATRLRALGLRWNKVLLHWEGVADQTEVAELAGENAGVLRRVRPSDETPSDDLGIKAADAI